MSSIEDRVTALEAEVTRLREQTTDTHTLAAHADRDVAEFRDELRAQTRLIGALRETQVEQSQELTALRRDMNARIDGVFTKLTGGLAQIVSMLERLDDGGTP